jgi:hypothetical protein
MRAGSSFQSILEQTLSAQAATDKAFNATRPTTVHSMNQTSDSVVDPAHLAFLLGALDRASFQKPVTRVYPAAPKPPPPPHDLTEEQRLAASFFAVHGAELSPAFTQKELKNAFRRTALRLHPDMNKGASGPFIALKKHYAELSGLFVEAVGSY